MAKNILFIVEGRRDESSFLISAFKKALKLIYNDFKVFKYKSSIYSLYDQMKNEGYDSLLSFLYSLDKTIFPDSFITPEDSFSSVYLLFDLDPQSNCYSVEKVKEMCKMFSDETRNGKLYLSVPMSQSIFDFSSYRQNLFNKKTYCINSIANDYKRESREKSFLGLKYGTRSFKTVRIEDIYSISVLNMKKYCFLTNEFFSEEWNEPFSSNRLVDAELPFIEKGKVSVLCGGILLIPDYSIYLLNELKKKNNNGGN